jgi:hypothetical protein
MLGVTIFGLIFTPVFYVLCRKLALFASKEIPIAESNTNINTDAKAED